MSKKAETTAAAAVEAPPRPFIAPTVGRRVWYRPGLQDATKMAILWFQSGEPQPMDAGVCFVHADGGINLSVVDHNGNSHQRLNVQLLQAGDDRPADGGFAEWMPYQIGQAKAAA